MVCIGIVVSCSCKDVVSQNHTFDLCRQLVFWIYSLRALIRNQLSWRVNPNVCIVHGTLLMNTFFIDKTAFAGSMKSTNISASCYVFLREKIHANKPLANACTFPCLTKLLGKVWILFSPIPLTLSNFGHLSEYPESLLHSPKQQCLVPTMPLLFRTLTHF